MLRQALRQKHQEAQQTCRPHNLPVLQAAQQREQEVWVQAGWAPPGLCLQGTVEGLRGPWELLGVLGPSLGWAVEGLESSYMWLFTMGVESARAGRVCDPPTCSPRLQLLKGWACAGAIVPMVLEVQGQSWGDRESAGAHPASWILRDNQETNLNVTNKPWMLGVCAQTGVGFRGSLKAGGAGRRCRAGVSGSPVRKSCTQRPRDGGRPDRSRDGTASASSWWP